MWGVGKQFGFLLLAGACVWAQSADNASSVQGLKISRQGDDVRIDLILSAPVEPSVVTAEHPDRLVLDLANAKPDTKQTRQSVNQQGVRDVRIALNSSNPLITRVVIDLDQAHPFVVHSEANRIAVIISPPVARNATRRGAPAAGASGGFIGIFRRNPSTPAPPEQASSVPVAAPAPELPISFQGEHSRAVTASADTNSSAQPPSAAHPKLGSLQEGTVFPSLGTPGAGNVPPTTATTGSFDKRTASAAPAPPEHSSVTASTAAAGNPIQHPSSGPAPAVSAALPVATPSSSSSNSTNSASSSSVSATVPAMTAPASQSRPSLPSTNSSAGQAAVSSSIPVPQPEAKQSLTPAAAPSAETAAPAVASTEAGSSAAEVTNNPAPVTEPVPVSSADQQMLTVPSLDPNLRTVFKVKYVADGVAYLDGGRSAGLAEGMKLEVLQTDLAAQQGTTADPADPRIVAELQVSGLADTSAVTDIHSPKRPVKVGDLAYLSNSDAQALVQQRTLSATRKYPAVVTFTEDDALDEEARAEIPRPPLPSVNRARGRIGFDYLGTVGHGNSALTSSAYGVVLRTDITRIGGSYWNLSGYWRGRLNSQSATGQQTLQQLINRTYHLSLTYANPNSAWVAGFGRLYLPWAPSLETIDGGYFGRRIGHIVTTGIFAGSTPDPTSYSYNPDQRIGGAFINFEGGSFEDWHYTSTSGLGVSFLKTQINRPFLFFENTVSYKNVLSFYDSLQADSPRGTATVPAPGPELSRNFFTARLQATSRIELHFNHTYFRDIPTFDPILIGTGLLDKYLFQGFSAGARVEVVKHIFVYSDLGRSSRTGDAKSALNQLYGLTFDRLPWLGLRADAHYSRFNSSFGDGSYKSFSLSRNLSDALRLEVLAGQQNFTSLFSTSNGTRFINANFESTLGRHYFLQGGYTFNRGSLSYDQWSVGLGYRFDSRSNSK